MLLGVDVGGTFTDAALLDGERLHTAKVPSTPDDQSRGVIAAIDQVLDRAGVIALVGHTREISGIPRVGTSCVLDAVAQISNLPRGRIAQDQEAQLQSLEKETTGSGLVRETPAAVLRGLNLRDNEGQPIADKVMLLEDLAALIARDGAHPEGLLQLDYKEDAAALNPAVIIALSMIGGALFGLISEALATAIARS